jgi:hypothetical protein
LSIFHCPFSIANDTVFVSGAVRHEGLLAHKPWYYGSQSYVDLSVHYLNDSNAHHFHSLQANVRGELTRWPMAGYEAGVVDVNTTLGAQTAWLKAHSECIDAGIELQLNSSRLKAALGNYTSDIEIKEK